MKKLSRQLHDGQIILDSKVGVKVGIRAMIAAGALALSGLILMRPNDVPVQPSTQTFHPRTGPTFELPRSDDGPNSNIDVFPLPEQTTSTSIVTIENTP